MGLLCGASELSLRAAVSARHTQSGSDLDLLPTSASGANPGHFLFGCIGASWKLNHEESPAPFLFLVLASAAAHPDRAAPSVHTQRLVDETGAEEWDVGVRECQRRGRSREGLYGEMAERQIG